MTRATWNNVGQDAGTGPALLQQLAGRDHFPFHQRSRGFDIEYTKVGVNPYSLSYSSAVSFSETEAVVEATHPTPSTADWPIPKAKA
jgi:hypothetical protein